MRASILLHICIASTALAVDMSGYVAQSGVEPAFANYLKELYASAEDPAATTAFTNFFPSDNSGKLIVVSKTATGAAAILALKQQLMPTSGEKHWNHRPNVTTVQSDTAQQKIYHVLGEIETTFDGGNCSKAYYVSAFTVAKKAENQVQLVAHSGNLLIYDDISVDPLESPTHIACGN